MKAVAIREFGGSDALRLEDLPRPRPGRGEVLLRVVAAGVSPIDAMICRGLLAEGMPHAFPLVLGWDAAGVVEELGEGTLRLRKGDRVFACTKKPTVQWGAYAEYVAVPERQVALMPARLLFEEAAGIPVAALAAYQALHGRAAIGPGATVLVHGAAGGVGHFALQLVRAAGARAIGTASASNREFVISLGAEAVVDYARDDFREAVRRFAPDGVDVVLDSVGGETLERSCEVVREGGIVVSLELGTAPASTTAVRVERLAVEPSGEQLEILSSQVQRGLLKPHVEQIRPLSDVAKVLDDAATGHARGKRVLSL